MSIGRTKDAEAEFRTAIDLYEQRSPEIEREPVEEKELALDYMRFAYLLATLGQPDEASRLLDKAARATERMGRDDKSANWTFALAVMRLRLLQDTTRRALTDGHGARFWLNRRDPMRLFADRPYLDKAIEELFGEATT